MSDQSYYITLAVIDRISELAIGKFGSFSAFSKKMGWKSPRWGVLYNNGRCINFNTLVRIAKVLDLSIEYLLTGKNKSSYIEENLSVRNLALMKIHGASNSIYSVLSKIRNNKQKDIGLITLFDIEEVSKKDIRQLLRGAQ